ncbi:hypothetical protein CBR_g44624 [Chara braunii]|uniref:Myb-like domain-containing protein n=1 Tax=Chara braunii TaxID=69332 RepID=A0A388LXY0_CHABU|nr:hypothetical protein CBR_g44624 [Chara braunii]|eukprot:GBG87166.1 hypothetical protein CBR_g44624 [Chara braunii]
MYSSDSGLYHASAPLAGAAVSATTGDVQTESHCRDYYDGGDPIIDADMGDAFTEPAVDIVGTQGGGRATVRIDDNEGATQCDDVIPWPDRVERSARAEGGGRGGQDKGKARVRGPDWTEKESMGLGRMMFEEDCAQQSRQGRQKIKGRREKYDWIIGKMVEQGFPKRTMEDCESKFYGLLDKAKKIHDYTSKSGKPSYRDMSRSEKKEAGLRLTYEKRMFDALQWKLGKADGSCEGMMHSVNLQGGQTSMVTDDDETGGSSESEGSRRKADSDSADGAKFRRTGGGSSHNRRSAPESSSDASRGGLFADIARALVEANDRHADKIAGSLVQVMNGMNKTMEEGNSTLLQCFTMLFGAMAGRPAFVPPGANHTGSRVRKFDLTPVHLRVTFLTALFQDSRKGACTRRGDMSSSPLCSVGEVVDMAGDFMLTHRRLIQQAHELARK